MKAELEQKLSELSLEEKSEVVTFLLPFVTPADTDGEISAELLTELNKRIAADEADPSGSITLEQFKNRQFGAQ